MMEFSPEEFLKELKEIQEAESMEQLLRAEKKVGETLKKLEDIIREAKLGRMST